jgi:hypothetical protein
MQERTFIGLDVHARSVQAGVLDGLTGEVRSLAVPVATKALVAWVCAQPAPAVTYEAGPTGYELARALAAAGVPCLVAAPSRIPRAPGERVKTDRRDAVRLARLLRLEELVAVRVPGLAEEAARDLMRARHRLSKLLLRRGIVWEARAWTGAHELWLARQRACAPPAGRGRLAAAPEAGQEPAHSPGAERPAGRGTASAPGLAERRLRRRRLRFDERGKRSTVAAVAVAREEHPRACYEQP